MTSVKTTIANPSAQLQGLMERMRSYKAAQYQRLAKMQKSDIDVVISVK